MRILYLTSRLPIPPITKGDTLRDFHFLKSFSQRGHKITLISFYRGNENTSSELTILKQFCDKILLVKFNPIYFSANLLRAIYSNKPFQVLLYRSKKLKDIIDDEITKNKYDVAYVHFARLGEYMKDINIPKVIDLQDLFSENMKEMAKKEKNPLKKLVASIESLRMKKYEEYISKKYDFSTVVSSRDIPKDSSNTIVTPLGIETSNQFKRDVEKVEKNSIIFFGNMKYFPNEDGAIFLIKQVMPLVWEKIPKAVVYIVGSNPRKQLTNLESRNVKITGYVENLQPFLEKTTIAIAPLRQATGTQIKVMDAMNAGIPQIITTKAADGLDYLSGDETIITSTNPKEISDKIILLLKDIDLQKKLSQKSREYIQKNFSWEKSADVLENLFLQISKSVKEKVTVKVKSGIRN